MSGSANRSSAPALERGLAILEVLARSRGGLTLSQLTRYLSLPKSSVFCLLRTLEQTGYLQREETSGKYTVTLRVSTLANLALSGSRLREAARPLLRKLCEATHLTVHMGVLQDATCVIIERMAPNDAAPVATWVGKRLSLHCTAIGKAICAHVPEAQLDAFIQEHGLLRHNENTICSLKRLKQDLVSVRERGYSVDNEEEELGIRCLGAPLFDGEQVLGAVSIVGSTTEISSETIQQQTLALIGTARRISGYLGTAHATAPDAAEYAPLREFASRI